MVTDRDGGAHAEHISALVSERFLVLEAAELTPVVMEFGRHAKYIFSVFLKEFGTDGHLIVAAPSGGEIL